MNICLLFFFFFTIYNLGGNEKIQKKEVSFFNNQDLLITFPIYFTSTDSENIKKVQVVKNSNDRQELFFNEKVSISNDTPKQKQCFQKQCCYPYSLGCSPKYYPPNKNILFAWGEWLLWKPFLDDDLRWILLNEITLSNSNAEVQSFIEKSLSYNWESGFRVGAGIRFACDAIKGSTRPWQLEATFTKLLAKVTPQQFETNDISVLSLLKQLPTNNTIAQIDRAKADAQLKYARIDGKVAWPVWFNENVIFRFMTGPIFAWIDQTLQASYNQIFTVSNTIFDFSNTELKWKFIGGGLLGGSDVYLYIGKGFGFFTNGSFGLLVGRMRSLEHYKQIEEENGIFVNRDEKYTRSFTQFKPTFTFSSGVDFKYWFAKCLMLHVLIGYEFNMLINMNQIGKINQRTDSNDAILEVAPKGAVFNADPSNLYFHGLNVRAGIDF